MIYKFFKYIKIDFFIKINELIYFIKYIYLSLLKEVEKMPTMSEKILARASGKDNVEAILM